MASWPAIKSVLSDLGQGHYLQKPLYLDYYMTEFYQTFIEIIALWSQQKCQGHHFQKKVYLVSSK